MRNESVPLIYISCNDFVLLLNSGAEAIKLGLTDRHVEDFGSEYGDLTVAVEVVDSMESAIRHIHTHGR